MTTPDPQYVGRGGHKLRAALDHFDIQPHNLHCADLGCSTGGFTDCLLQAGAASVHAVDTAYGQLAWKLRNDPRVVVMERTNALHASPPRPVSLVAADMSWTPQRLLVPAALRWLAPGGRLITLIKPHYEIPKRDLPRGGVLDEPAALSTLHAVLDAMPTLGARVLGVVPSPVLGGADGKGKGHGNREYLALLARLDDAAS